MTRPTKTLEEHETWEVGDIVVIDGVTGVIFAIDDAGNFKIGVNSAPLKSEDER